ncbi:MAG: hypothetical protein EAZ24_00965 [Burkholderiales bacterium]|nr:MAG: hypothetical protein EAZ21_11075 [Betaproteobacteria bacterium]TAG84598.1 MAG: hypothetical protein EAZ24_00965 [Burkholderiales bacterium]
MNRALTCFPTGFVSRAADWGCPSAAQRIAAECFFWGVMLCSVLIASGVSAQANGTLDTSWEGVGYVKTPIISPSNASSRDDARAIAIQLDGKVVVAGLCQNTSTNPASFSLCVARYQVNGSLDISFNTTGVVTVALSAGNANRPKISIALAPNARILVALSCFDANGKEQFCVYRFFTNGQLDTGFALAGRLMTNVPAISNYVGGVALQSDDKIIVGGICGVRLCALRYDADGIALDTSFGNSGTIENVATGSFNRETYSLAVDASDRVLLAGTCSISSQTVFCLSRFTSNGAADTSFDSDGLAQIPALPGGQDYAYALALQNDGKILVAGQAFNTIGSGSGSTVFDFATVRYNENGTLDTAFNAGVGFVVTRIANSYSEARAVVSRDDGKIIVAGYCEDFSPVGERFCLVSYNADGSLDTGFNGSGISKLLLGPQSSFAVDQSYALAIGRDGKLYAAGSCRRTTPSVTGQYDFCVARYTASVEGALACFADFGNNGGLDATRDSLIHRRVVAGLYDNPFGSFAMTGSLGIPFFQNFWTPTYLRLLRSSIDYDGDGVETTTDTLIHTRIALGYTGNSVTAGITFAPSATRATWTALRNHLVSRCGVTLLP